MMTRLAFGDFELDEARFELRRRGEPVAIQPKVLDLILFLARHRDRVVTKDELFETVWKGTAVTDASLSQAVSLARSALGDTPNEQHTIRTVRRKGLQFVAPSRPLGDRVQGGHLAVTDARGRPADARLVSTMVETEQADAPKVAEMPLSPRLYAVLHGEAPSDGGASWGLADVDEVQLVRASEWRTERKQDVTRLLRIAVPGRLLSRQHARIVRTPADWVVIDDGSRNGTFVNEERVDKRVLAPDDLIECGHTIFRFATEPLGAGAARHLDARSARDTILSTVTPRVAALDEDLRSIASSNLPVLIFGESGTGKSHVAQALHSLSARPGALVRLDAAALASTDKLAGTTGAGFERARQGTLLIENVDCAPDTVTSNLVTALDTAPDVRVVCTSAAPATSVERRLPADLLMRLSGFRCHLPPLRERPGDLGVLVGNLLTSVAQPAVELDTAAMRALVHHAWPGNVRELSHALQVAVTLSGGSTIRLEHLPPELRVRST